MHTPGRLPDAGVIPAKAGNQWDAPARTGLEGSALGSRLRGNDIEEGAI